MSGDGCRWSFSLSTMKMAAIRGIRRCSLANLSRPNYNAPPHLSLSRGFASKLFVKGIPFSTTEKVLEDAFSKYGKVLEAKVIMNKARTRSKGYGFVTFDSEDDTQRALDSMNGKLLNGRVIYVGR